MAKHGGKPNNIALYTRACAYITGVLCFLLSQVSHKHYNPLCNNHLHWFQKQHPSLSHFHAATPPQKLPKTPSSKQLFDLQSKTTRCFPQNDTSLSTKRHVTFHKTTRCFQQNHTSLSIKRCVVFGMMKYFQFHPLWHLWQQKNKTRRTGARIHARVRTPSVNPKPSPHSIKSNSAPFRTQSTKIFTYEELFISNETTIDKSAMKQPTTNHSSNPKPILICTTYTPVSQSKGDKSRYRQRKNGTNMPFFHSLGLFPPIY